MKNAKRFASLVLALVMVFSLAATAFAATVEVTEKGSITIKDNATVMASKKTFAAYKVLDLKAYKDETTGEITNYSYTVPAALADFYADRYDLDKAAADFATKVVAEIAAEENLYAFAEAVLAACDGKVAPNSGAPTSNGYKFSTLDLGYYVIEDTTAEGDYKKPVSALVLDTVTPDVEVVVKAEKPPVDKVIDDDNNLTTTDDRVESNEAAIGDTITYVITSKVPDMTGYEKYFFIMKDTMSKGLTYNANSMTVKVGDKTLEDDEYTLTIVANEDGTTSMKIVFHDFLQYNTKEFIGKPVEVTYTATLNEDCEINKIPNTNEVYLEYSNDPDVEYNGEDEPDEEDKDLPPLGETPRDYVYTYTTAMEVIKTDPLGNRLEGAEFQLTGEKLNIVRVETDVFTKDENGEYWLLTDGSYTKTDPESIVDGATIDKTKYASLTDKYSMETVEEIIKTKENVEVTATVGTDGIVRFEGLSEGTYTLTETKAPEGYNILTEELEIIITWNEETGEFSFEGASNNNGVAQVTVVNQSGTELPSTGGMGTTLFYLFGGIMVLAAVVLLVTRRRMSIAE